MPYVGGAGGQDIQTARKRRWNDNILDDQDVSCFRLLSPDQYFSPDCAVARKILPLASKRARLLDNSGGGDLSPPHHHTHNSTHQHRRRPSSQQHDNHNHKTQQFSAGIPAARSTRPNAASLAPCHICHRRPTKKTDLNSFAECQGCGAQTCFICIRECQGKQHLTGPQQEDAVMTPEEEHGSSVVLSFEMINATDEGSGTEPDDENQAEDKDQHQQHTQLKQQDQHQHDKHDGTTKESENTDGKTWHGRGHRSVVCSACCVEEGSEGQVVCLGCLSGITL